VCGAFGTFAHQAYTACLRGQLSSNVRQHEYASLMTSATESHPLAYRGLLVALCLALPVSLPLAQEPTPDHLRFLATNSLFERIRATSGFNLEKEATYGYFFTGSDLNALDSVRSALTGRGYQFVSQHEARRGSFVLQMAKVEVHTVNSLVARNRELFDLAQSIKEVRYDGWDITRNE
jgi:hypothetical protein